MIDRIAGKLGLNAKAVESVLQLFQEGATIPFIARYRKEATGGLNEVQLFQIQEEWERQQEVEKRQAAICKAIEQQGKLTPELQAQILQTFDPALLEDLYLPYKQKRQTRAAKARAKGLEPLAMLLLEQKTADIERQAQAFVNESVEDAEEALDGARDIIAEYINEHPEARAIVRQSFERGAELSTEVVPDKKDEAEKYANYFEFDMQLRRVQPHQLLAILRAESEGVLRFKLEPQPEPVIDAVKRRFIQRQCPQASARQLELAIEDSYKRLILPSISTEFLNAAKDKADEYSIGVFAENLRQLLLASPLGNQRTLALDPGYASGCKAVCLSATGDLLHHGIIYPLPPRSQVRISTELLQDWVEEYDIQAIAIGNGTGGRETEKFVRSIDFGKQRPSIFLVNESGASVYSASEIGRKEFPNEDITVRGAVSIGRRLMDPLAELVKIDPKSIGVGQYQHDVNQRWLQNKLNAVVESCVNAVGVDVNTASEYLLTHVSGLGQSLAYNIVEHRRLHGMFQNRRDLLKVPRLGNKAFEQAAGFLRIRNGENPLDNTAVHPSAYGVVEQMAKDLKCTVSDLIAQPELRKQIDLQRYVQGDIGLPTLQDILSELEKPGRDPRPPRQAFEFANIQSIADLHNGMSLPGIVTNITAFGVFVDIGIKENGLIHKSKLSHRPINDPGQVVKLGQELQVSVVGVDVDRARIQLSLID